MASASHSANTEFDPCPICFEPLDHQEAYLDRCFHAFCYRCIAYWSRLVGEKKQISSIKCPLCKTENFSIIHGYTGDFFKQDFVNQKGEKSSFSGVHEFRLRFYGKGRRMGNTFFDVEKFWKCRRYLQRNIWLQNWLQREIQILIQEEDVDIIVHHIHGVVESFMRSCGKGKDGGKTTPEQNRSAFKLLVSDAARPFLLGHTEQFMNELEQFLSSGLNIEAYDEICMQQLAMYASSEERKEPDEEAHEKPWSDPYLQLLCEDSDGTAD